MLTPEQLANRSEYIGGSDVAIIMGTSPFKTPWQLLLEKARIAPNNFSGNKYTKIGNLLEPKIQEAMKIKNVDERTYEKTYFEVPFAGHIDGLNDLETELYEIKVSSGNMEKTLKTYEYQIRTYMYLTELDKAHIVLLQRDKELSKYLNPSYQVKEHQLVTETLFHNEQKEEEMLKRTRMFWNFRNKLIKEPHLANDQEFLKFFYEKIKLPGKTR